MRLSRQRRQPEESKERKNMSGGGANGNIGSLCYWNTNCEVEHKERDSWRLDFEKSQVLHGDMSRLVLAGSTWRWQGG